MFKLEDLDSRICDIEEGSKNTQTLREFIKQSEEEFEMNPVDLGKLSEDKLNGYIEFLDDLWTK